MEKQCRNCKQIKPLSEFYRLSKARAHKGDGHDTRCKECAKAYGRTPERRKAENEARRKKYQIPEVRKRIIESARKRAADGRYKEIHRRAHKKYEQTLKGKINRKKVNTKYRKTQSFKDAINRYRAKFPERRQARIALAIAVAADKIIRPSKCSICQRTCNPHAHHPDYSKPLEVIWLCRQCHANLHWSSFSKY